jgi:hypothetical protein
MRDYFTFRELIIFQTFLSLALRSIFQISPLRLSSFVTTLRHTTLHSQKADLLALGGIRNPHPSNSKEADP